MSFYIPGKAFTPSGSANTFNQKRVLSTEEYDYYKSFLNSNLPDPVKAGIAVVLLADLKRWAGVNTILVDEYTDPKITEYVNLFLSYPEESPEKNLARQEITKFDQFLTYSEAPNRGQVALDIEEANKSFAVRLATEKRSQQAAQTVEEILAQELQDIKDKEDKDLIKDQGKAIEKAIEIHMKTRIREYLSVTYNESVGRFFINQSLSDKEYSYRMNLINKVQSGEKKPMEAINEYRAFVESFSDISINTSDGQSVYEHPFLRLSH